MIDPIRFNLDTASQAIFDNDNPDFQNFTLSVLYRVLDQASIMDDRESVRETITANGVCLAPTDAANCLRDTKRTVKFVRGLADAILEVRNKYPERKTRVLYAGCGPFASLALPITHIYEPSEVEFTVIDIHKESITNVKRLVHLLGLQQYFKDFICKNALDYKSQEGEKFDVLVTETMTAGLFEEPQAAISTHLVKELTPDGILVPEEITVDVRISALNALSGKKHQNHPRTVNLGDLIRLNKETKRESFTPELNATFDIPPQLDRDLAYLIILHTRVKIYGKHILNEGESGITRPIAVKLPRKTRIRSKLNITYQPGNSSKLLKVKLTDD